MASIYPFNALRPAPGLAGEVCELPYDVMNSEEAREMAKNKPLSFLHVSKPEIDLELGIDVHSPSVYTKGAENFDLLQEQGVLLEDSSPCFYLYQQVMDGHKQVGIVAVASCEEYDSGIIKKHEYTRPAKEDDRVHHIESLNSQTGPVFLTYRAMAAIDMFVKDVCNTDPDVDFEAVDGVQHTSWVLDSKEDIDFLKEQFGKVEFLYIADGHHRSAAASRVNASRGGAGQSSRFLSVLFPHDQMQILAYNRAIKTLNGISPQTFLEQLRDVFDVNENAGGICGGKNEICLYMNGQWKALAFNKDKAAAATPADGLDVALLQNHVLGPMLGINDPRTSSQIEFVGGIRGAAELEKMVDEGGYVCAFSLYPTSIEDLMEIADSDGIMPPKSTWFEPKLRDAMFCHKI